MLAQTINYSDSNSNNFLNESCSIPAWLQSVKKIKSHLTSEQMYRFLHSLKIDSLTDISDYIIYNDLMYSRNRVYKNNLIDILVMCWKPGQFTPIHDHKDSVCGVRVLDGVSTEIQYSKSTAGYLYPTSHSHYTDGAIMASQDEDTHQMGNLESVQPLITLHAYSPPLKNMQIYSLNKTIFNNHETVKNELEIQMGRKLI